MLSPFVVPHPIHLTSPLLDAPQPFSHHRQKFNNEWGSADTEDAVPLSGVDNVRLKACFVDASASVWGGPAMQPAQINVCYCILHPHCPNHLLVVVHWMGGGEDAHTEHAQGNQAGFFYFYSPPHAVCRRHAHV